MPLVAFIGRLDYQKGADMVLGAAEWLMSHGCQVVFLGAGNKQLEGQMQVMRV